VQNGPLQNATVWADAYLANTNAGNGLFDSGEMTGTTDATGNATITNPATGFTLIAQTTNQTVDTVTNVAYTAGMVFKAPEGSTKITPQTTMIEAIIAKAGGTVTAATLKTANDTIMLAMGLDPTVYTDIDLTTYDAYASTNTAAENLLVQKANNNVMSVVATMAATYDGAGVDSAAAAALAFEGMMDYVDKKALDVANGVVGADSKIDFVTDIDAVFTAQTSAYTAFVGVGGAGAALGLNDLAVTNMVTAAKAKVLLVTTSIKAFDANTTEAEKIATFKVISALANEVETTAETMKANATSVAVVTFDVATAITNVAPTDIMLAGSTTTDTTYTATSAESVAYVENTVSLAVGVLSATDTDRAVGTPTDFLVVGGADMAKFEITKTGSGATEVSTLSFKAAPDYETQTSFVVAVSATDASGAAKVETFTVNITDDTTEGGAFGISSDLVVFTDYNTLGNIDVTNTVLASTTGTAVTIGSATPSIQLNKINMVNFTNDSFVGTAKSPSLKFTLDSVPTGNGVATIKATVTDGLNATRSDTEDQISLTVTVAYQGDGTTGTITVPAGLATGTYDKGNGTSVAFSLANGEVDAYSITAANAVTGMPASLDVKLGALFDAFVNAGGASDIIQEGSYHVAIETTLPLQNAANETVTTFGGVVTLQSSTTEDSLIGTDGADTLVGGNTGQLVYGGLGGYDTISVGSGTDYLYIQAHSGGSTSAHANTLTGFANGTDKFLLGNTSAGLELTFDDLTIAQGTTAADTLISITATSARAEEFLMHVTGVAANLIDTFDFVGDVA